MIKRNKKQKLIDRDICCTYINKETRIQYTWKTTDSARQTLTTNISTHLQKHSIYPPTLVAMTTRKKPSSIATFFRREDALTNKQLLEKNLLRWIVTEK
jgi:hypothetical protein